MSAPACKTCGKPIPRRTVSYLFQNPRKAEPERHDRYGVRPATPEIPEGATTTAVEGRSYVLHVSEENRPATKSECQRFTNHKVLSVKRGTGGKLGSFNTWDGESYQPAYGHFCTIQCAARFGQVFAAAGYNLTR